MTGVGPQHRGGTDTTTIGMVVAIIVAVLLLGVLIWMFTQQEELRATADQATRAKQRLASGSEEAEARLTFPDAGGPGKTLIGEMNRSLGLLSRRMTGSQEDAPQIAVKKLDTVLDAIRDQVPNPEEVSGAYGAATIIEKLHGLYAGARSALDEKETDLQRTKAELVVVRAANGELESNFKAELASLSTKVEELQRAKNEFERVKGSEVTALARQISDKQDVLDAYRRNQSKLLRQFRTEIAARDRSIDEQRRALGQFRGEGTAQAAEPLSIARQPVGRVLRALPGDSLVHIDLGRQDNVTLGMTFSVYSADERIGTDGRGKANVEVVSLGERTSECRITTSPSPDDPILTYDRVGNIALSRNRAKKTRICVVGQFDIDGDGHPDARGAEAMRALAGRYGAEVVGSVDGLTDYLVVGLEPAAGQGDYFDEDAEEEAGEEEDEYVEEDEELDEEYDEEDEDEYDEEDDDEYDDEYDEEDDDESDDEEEDDEEDDEEADDEELDDENGSDDEEEDDEELDEDGESGDEEAEDEYADEYEDDEEADRVVADVAFEAPSIPRMPEIDPTATPRKRRARTEREKYYQAVRRAEMFAIPRLRQDQFFNFIGIEIGPDAAKRLMR